LAAGAALAGLLAACAGPTVNVSAPVGGYPAPVVTSTAPASLEYGRVTNIEFFQGGVARSGPNVPGALIGAVAGAVLGNQIGGGTGRDVATVLGGAAGAAVGSQVGRTASATDPIYRVSIQTDSGAMRTYDVPGTGELRVGDRVRVENGVIYRS